MLTDSERSGTAAKRATRSIGLVLVGTAALMLGMPGCDRDKRKGAAGGGNAGAAASTTQRSTGRTAHGAGFYGSSRAAAGGTSDAASPPARSGNTSRGGFGSTGRSVGS